MIQSSAPIRCSLCIYWQNDQKNQHERTGLCRRYAPRPITEFSEIEIQMGGQSNFAPVCWPITSEWDWCGEFSIAEEEIEPDLTQT